MSRRTAAPKAARAAARSAEARDPRGALGGAQRPHALRKLARGQLEVHADVVLERAHHHAGQVGARGVGGGLEAGDVVVGEFDQVRAVFGGHAGR
jgi:hypothetical protein